MESLSAYIPMDRRRAMALGTPLPERMCGTALFADVSGFTLLTEAYLQSLGARRGADELTKQLNQVYDALIREVYNYQGSIINFSGDAITCWFDQDAGLRAATCGLAMQRAMDQFATVQTPDGETVALSVKVAAAGGPVRRFLVGNPHIQYIDVMAGATLDRMAAGEKYAQRGELLLSQEIVSHLNNNIMITEWRDKPTVKTNSPPIPARFAVVGDLFVAAEPTPWPVLFSPNESESWGGLTEFQIKPWLLPPVYEHLRNGQGQFLAEIRPAVVLFLKFDGLEYDHDAAAGEKLDAYIRWVQDVLVPYDSYVMQLLIGDKGSYLYAIFGAPLAHDDDAERAVSAALELQASSQNFNFISQVQIGISQGRLRVGAYGSTTRRTYGVLGDDVNVAARLMGKAEPGQILVSQRIVKAAAQSYYFKYLGSAIFKGKQEAIAVSTVLSPRQFSAQRLFFAFTDPLVGRDRELEQLQQILAAILAGQKQIVWLKGVTGIGKTHLITEFAERALQAGLQVSVGACQSAHQAVSYYPWQQIFRNLLGLVDHRSESISQKDRLARQITQLETIINDINPGWLLRLPLLGDLLDLPIPDNATTAAFEPQLRQETLFSLVEELLQTWAQDRPLLLLLEDGHWIDEASRALLLFLSRVQAKLPILLILVQSSTPAENGDEILHTELTRLSEAHCIILSELSTQEMTELVTQRLPGGISPLALDMILAQAQGNPLFAKELIDALRESDHLQQHAGGLWSLSEAMIDALHQANCLTKGPDGQWMLVENAPLVARLDLPDSIHSIVLARLDRLPEPLKVTLKVASVIGRLFEFELLARAHPTQLDEMILQEQMIRLQELDFIQPEISQQQLTYLFRHNITHEVTYATLLEQQERSLHRVVAETLEDWQPEAIERLAYHYSRGDVREKMLHYLGLAALKAQREYANETALGYFTQALALEERWIWRKGQVEVLHILGQREKEQESLEALAANSESPTFEISYLWGQYYEAIGDYPQAQTAIELALADSRDQEDLIDEARCLSYLGLIARRQGDYEQAKAWYRHALILFQDKQNYTEQEARSLTRAFNGMGVVHRQQGDFDQARHCHKQALVLSNQTDNLSGEAQACNDLGAAAFYQRRLGEALTYQQQALEIRRAIGDRAGEGISLQNLAQIAVESGDYSRAQRYLAGALNILQTTGNRWDEVNVWNDLGILYQELGNLSKAESCLRRGLTLAQEIGDEAGQAYLTANLGLVARDQGEFETAEALFTEGLVLAQTQDDQYLVSIFFNYLSLVGLQTGEPEQAIAYAEASLMLRQELKMRFATPDNLAVLAVAYLADDLRQAVAYAEQAEAILAECGGEGPEFPQQDYFYIYRVLTVAGQTERAQVALQSAYDLVMTRADKISEPDLHQSFLEEVGINRAIVKTYQTLNKS